MVQWLPFTRLEQIGVVSCFDAGDNEADSEAKLEKLGESEFVTISNATTGNPRCCAATGADICWFPITDNHILGNMIHIWMLDLWISGNWTAGIGLV